MMHDINMQQHGDDGWWTWDRVTATAMLAMFFTLWFLAASIF